MFYRNGSLGMEKLDDFKFWKIDEKKYFFKIDPENS